MRVLISPAEIIYGISNLGGCEIRQSKAATYPTKSENLALASPANDGIQLPQLSPRKSHRRNEKGARFIALGISVYDSETTLEEMACGLDHVVSHPLVKWSIKVMNFSG